MRIAAAILALALTVPATAFTQSQEILIFGGNGHEDFLGCLTCSEFDSKSIWNEFSKHGWENDFGTWNDFGPNASQFGSRSACNEYASDPPVLVDRKGNYYGRLTISETKADSVCGTNGADRICMALKVMCADD